MTGQRWIGCAWFPLPDLSGHPCTIDLHSGTSTLAMRHNRAMAGRSTVPLPADLRARLEVARLDL